MKIKELSEKVPWITKDGYFDVNKLPIDNILRRVVYGQDQDWRHALGFLTLMHDSGRKEAGIFLMGYLLSYPDDWKKKEKIVEALRGFNTKECADLMFSEIKRVKSSDTTRGYIDSVLFALSGMPLELIEGGFEDLINDRRFTYRMKDKFKRTLWKVKNKDRGPVF